jgi:hypothetical protein
MFVLLLTGPPGAGKTVTLIALSDALIDDGIAHAAVDVDEVAWAYPFPSLEQRCKHLRAWAAPHLEAGHELLLVSEVLESAAHTSAVLSALGADDRLLVWLDAPTSTMRRRVSAREPEGWSGLPRMLDEIPKLRAALAELADIDLVLDSEQVEASGARPADSRGASRQARWLARRPAQCVSATPNHATTSEDATSDSEIARLRGEAMWRPSRTSTSTNTASFA